MEAERRTRESAPARYRPRRPNQSVLYRCVQEHLETWLAQCRDGHDDDDGPVPPYVEREFRRYWSAASWPTASPGRAVGNAGTTS
jgi:hypothetical protein